MNNLVEMIDSEQLDRQLAAMMYVEGKVQARRDAALRRNLNIGFGAFVLVAGVALCYCASIS